MKLLLLVEVVLFLAQFSLAAHVFDSYRLVQFDKNGDSFGSRRTAVNHIATAVTSSMHSSILPFVTEDGETKRSPNEFARKIVTVNIREITPAVLTELTDMRGVAGVLILLDEDLESVPVEEIDQWKEFERFLLGRSFRIPIYFSFTSPELNEMQATLTSSTMESVIGRYQLVVSSPEATLMPTVPSTNFQGWLHSAPTLNADSDTLPTIAVVANYDTFGAAPGLSVGVDHNGSGTLALLELARIFSRLYNEFRTHGPYNILFVLTGGGRLNFAGTKHWLRTVDSRVLENLQFALCLESIGQSGKLYLHISKQAKTTAIKNLYDSFVETAELMDIDFEFSQRKINISDANINWQHEQFSRKRIISATLSNNPNPSPEFGSASIFDRRHTVNASDLRRNIKFIAETLSKHIYSLSGQNLEVISDSQDVNENFVNAWLDFLSTEQRVVSYLTPKTEVVVELEKVLNQYTSDTKALPFSLEGEYQFYKGATSVQMSAFKVKPFTFDVFLSLAIVLYLICFHFVCKLDM